MQWACCNLWPQQKPAQLPGDAPSSDGQSRNIEMQRLLTEVSQCAEQLQHEHDPELAARQSELLQRLEMLWTK